jgi:NADH-quinone oxidoreductase subunit M
MKQIRFRGVPVTLLLLLLFLSIEAAFLPHAWLPVAVLVLPLVGAIVGLLLPPRVRGKTWGFAVSASTLFVAISMAFQFDWHKGGYQFVLNGPAIEQLGVRFSLGVDSISLMLVVLAAALHPLAVTASLRSIHGRSREHYAWMNFLQVTVLGTFMSTDLLLFFIFFEASLIPLFFIVGIWGGKERARATNKMFLYTFSASVFALAAIIYCGFRAHTFYLPAIVHFAQTQMSQTERFWVLMGFLVTFGVKTPLFPLHTWLPLAHTEAPTAGSVDLAALVLKLGTYGLLRVALPIGLIAIDGSVLFPAVLTGLAVVCLIAIIYGALVAWVQRDIKRLIAYSSVSHMGFCVLGLLALNSIGMAGSVLYMINHGLISGALFLVVGMIYHRFHTRDINELSGLARAMPKLAFFTMFFMFAAIGLPGLNGFVSEFLSILGAFTSPHLGIIYGVIASIGFVLGPIYMLTFGGRIMWGPLHYPVLPEGRETHRTIHPKYVTGDDITGREVLVLTPLAIAVLVLGLFPTPLMRALQGPLDAIRNPSAALVQQQQQPNSGTPQLAVANAPGTGSVLSQ